MSEIIRSGRVLKPLGDFGVLFAPLDVVGQDLTAVAAKLLDLQS
jgi:hypothetical protein